MMKKTAAAVAALMLAACSGDSPSNALFEKTINNYAKKEGVCLPLLLNVQDPWGVESFTPVALGSTTVKIAEKDSKGNRINKTALKQMELLEDEGFYDKAESETLTKAGGGEKIRLSVYKLTRKGTEQVRGGEAEPRFCIGLQKVEKINWYTEPASSNGMTVSRVSYKARMEPEKWAEKLIRAGGGNMPFDNKAAAQTAVLVKTSKGWKDMRELN